MTNLTVSEHFQFEMVGDGVYAAFAKATGVAVSNAGVVDLGEKVVIFDTFLSPTVAQQLRQGVEQSLGKPIRFVVNSHHHVDHVGGNSVFAGQADLISSVASKQLISNSNELNDYRQNARTQLESLLTKSQKPGKGTKQLSLGAEIRYYEAVITVLPELQQLVSPSIAFENRLIIEGSKRTVEVINYGGGHSQSDTILYVPDAKIVFTGDLLTVGQHPYLADGDPGEFDRILNQINGLSPQYLIPGHGPIAEIDDLRIQRQYITMLTEIAMREIVYGAADSNDAAQRAANTPIPPKFANWEFSSYFHENLLFLYRRLLAAYAD